MQTRIFFALVFCLIAKVVAAEPSDQSARNAIAAALEAHGGEQKLSQQRSNGWIRFKFTHINPEDGKEVDATGEFWYKEPNRYKQVLKTIVGGTRIPVTKWLTGPEGWIKRGQEPAEKLPEGITKNMNEHFTTARATRLYPLLRDKSYRCSFVGEATVNKSRAIEIKVTNESWRWPCRFYLDNKSHLLTKTTRFQLSLEGKKQLVEDYYLDYQKHKGLMMAKRVIMFLDGKKYADTRILESRPLTSAELNDPKIWTPE